MKFQTRIYNSAPWITTLRAFGVNCYLLNGGKDYFLVDSGFSFGRNALKKFLEQAGCHPGNLKMVIVTHADFDHTGNCAWLQREYHASIAIHEAEARAVQTGRMLLNRGKDHGGLSRPLIGIFGMVAFHRFDPDVLVAEGDDLARYGLDARVLHIPGHSKGSIGILLASGEFFCGDLMTGGRSPAKNHLVDDAAEMEASIRRLSTAAIKTVYPGHGSPFSMAQYRDAVENGARG